MSVATITGALWPKSGRVGPFKDNSGNLWIVLYTNNPGPNDHYSTVFKSTDGGATWGTSYAYSTPGDFAVGYYIDAIFDSTNQIIYYVAGTASGGIRLFSFTLSNTTFAEIYSSGTRPTAGTDVNGDTRVFLTRRSTGEFVIFYQGVTHSLMGNPYRACYYVRCSAAGVWSAGVEISGAVKLIHYDCKSAVLGASDRTHMFFTGSGGAVTHRSVSSTNVLDTAGQVGSEAINVSQFWSAYYDAALGKIVAGTNAGVSGGSNDYSFTYRATSGGADPQTWTKDTNTIGYNEVASSGSPPAFIYEPTGSLLYVFFRDAATDDVYVNSTTTTTWTTANATLQDAGTVAGISVGPIYDTSPLLMLPGAVPSTLLMGNVSTTEKYAQQFTPTADMTLNTLVVMLAKNGAPTDNVIIELCADSAGSPGTVLATLATLAGTSLSTTSNSIVTITGLSTALTASTTYHIVIRRDGSLDASNYYIAYSQTVGAGWEETLRKYNTTWGTLGSAWLLISLYPAISAIGIVFNDNGTVKFDTFALVSGDIDSATITAKTTPSTTELFAGVDAGTVTNKTTPISTAEGKEYTDSTTVTNKTTPVSTSEIAGFVDAQTIGTVTTPITTTETREDTEAATVSTLTTPSSTEIYTPASIEYTDSGTIANKTTPSSTELTEFVDSSTVSSVTAPSTTSELYAIIEANTVSSTTTPITTLEIRERTSQATITSSTSASSVELYAIVEAQTVTNTTTPSGTDIREYPAESATVTVTTTPISTSELLAAVDAQTVNTVTSPITTVELHEIPDSDTVTNTTTPSSTVEIVEFVDSDTVASTTVPSTTDIAEFVESATVSSITTPSGVDVFALAPQIGVPISDIATNSWLPSDGTSPLYSLIDELSPDTSDYIYAVAT